MFDEKGHHCSKGQKEKLDLKLISKRSYKSKEQHDFEVFEQSNESDIHLEVSEDNYNPEIDEISDSEKDSSEFRYKSKSKQNENMRRFRKIKSSLKISFYCLFYSKQHVLLFCLKTWLRWIRCFFFFKQIFKNTQNSPAMDPQIISRSSAASESINSVFCTLFLTIGDLKIIS